MEINKQELEDLEELAQSNPIVLKLLTQWKEFYNSPYYDTYITLYNQIKDWNEQLIIKEVTIVGENNEEKKVMLGRVDLFGSKDEKDFDRVWKYLSDSVTILEQLDKIRAKLTPEEKKISDSRAKKHTAVAV